MIAVHRETRQLQGYAMVVAKKGFTLQPLKDDCDQSAGHSGGTIESLEARCVSMDGLAMRLGFTPRRGSRTRRESLETSTSL